MAKMKKIILFTLILVLLLFISGCNLRTGGQEPFTETEFHRGSNGLVINYLRDLPPREIVELAPFKVGVELQNLGVSDIKKGFLIIGNVQKEYFNILSDEMINFTLQGKGLSNPKGEKKIFTFTLENIKIIKGRQVNNFFFTVSSCYDYRTEASIEVCIKPISIEGARLGSDICQIRDISLSGQGAPVAVTRIQQSILPEKDRENSYKIFFNILVSNVGGGIVVGSDEDDYKDICRGLAAKDIALEDIKVKAELSGEVLECKKAKPDEERSDQMHLSCSTVMDTQESYTTPLVIIMDYGYITRELKKSLIIREFQREDICDADYCIEDIGWGVCSPIYGEEREELTQTCSYNEKCCTESESKCEREEPDHDCLDVNECNPDTIVSLKCAGPNNIKCCVRKS